MIGTTLLHYRVLRAIGRGGMGEVYAAEDTKLHRTVALKVLPQDMASDPERLQRFQREAQAVAALNHPNVVTVYSVEEANGLHFLTMELVDGKTLVDLLPKKGLPFDEFLKLAIALVDAVSAAHQRGIVHRDLKPANVMVGPEGRLKVLDFGLAKLRPEHGTAESSLLTVADISGDQRVLGTASYMSPEQAEGHAVDARTDVFSLGVVLYEMATGMRPFTGDSAMSVISSILKDTPQSATAINPQLPDELDRILRRCLAKDPSRRYQSALDLRNDLEDLASSAHARSPRRVVSRPQLLWFASAGTIAIAIVAVSLMWRTRATPMPVATFTKLTATPGREWFPSLSPDGKWIVYGGESSGNFDIYLQSVSGSNSVNLTRDSKADDDMPAFSPDGERIVFRSSRDGGGIFVMGRTGESLRRLTRVGFNPAWSSDGAQIAFTTGRMDVNPQNSEGKTDLWIVDVSGGEPRQLTNEDAIQPSWSPHKKRIAFATRRFDNLRRTDIWTIPVEGGAATAVMDDPPYDWNPIWAPDGQHLYFISDRGGTMNLWRIAIDENTGRARGDAEPIVTPAPFFAHPTVSSDGTHLAYSSVLMQTNVQKVNIDPDTATVTGDATWITTGSRLWSNPDPSPDGQFVVFYSRVEPEGDLYVSRVDGTGLRQLTSDQALDRMPHWSPDGAWISTFSNRSGKLQIWKIRPDGSDLTQITDNVIGDAAYSAWSPDASRLAVSSANANADSALYVFDPTRRWNEQKPERLPPIPGSQQVFRVNSWSSDGERLAGEEGATVVSKGIVVYTLRTRTSERLTDFGEWPVWMPDSRRILFGDAGKNFWVVDRQTKETKAIYAGGRDVIGPPRLTRDGRAAFFTRRISEADIWLMTLR